MQRKLAITVALLIASFLLLLGCQNAQKTAAQAALDLAQKAVDTFNDSDAAKFLPDQARDIQQTLQSAKESFAKGEYAAALVSAKSLPAKVKQASDAWDAKKQEIAAKFNELNQKMPALSAQVQSKIDALQRAHRLPPGIADGYAQFKSTWAEASDAFKAGHYSVAIARTNTAMQELAGVQSALQASH